MKKQLIEAMFVVVSCLSVVALGAEAVPEGAEKAFRAEQIKRGGYLVIQGGCHDCHTPFKMTAEGPAPDFDRQLSGHPEAMVMPPVPALPPGPWIGVMSATNTAWAGPWGVSFTANLTPDKETGTGAWTEQMFLDTLRSGRHLGRGREILPPMPWKFIGQWTDADLKAVFAYLQSIPAIKNKVPQPLPPAPAPVAAAKTK